MTERVVPSSKKGTNCLRCPFSSVSRRKMTILVSDERRNFFPRASFISERHSHGRQEVSLFCKIRIGSCPQIPLWEKSYFVLFSVKKRALFAKSAFLWIFIKKHWPSTQICYLNRTGPKMETCNDCCIHWVLWGKSYCPQKSRKGRTRYKAAGKICTLLSGKQNGRNFARLSKV